MIGNEQLNGTLMIKIGYFGDSFCESKAKDSWCVLLADRLDAEVVNWGSGGASIWKTLMEYESFKEKDIIPGGTRFIFPSFVFSRQWLGTGPMGPFWAHSEPKLGSFYPERVTSCCVVYLFMLFLFIVYLCSVCLPWMDPLEPLTYISLGRVSYMLCMRPAIFSLACPA